MRRPDAESRAAAHTLEEPSPSQRELLKDEPHTLVWTTTLPAGDRAVIKMYRRRGAFDFWRGRIFGFRVEREYEKLAHLTRHGVSTSRPISWSYGNSAVHGRFEILATEQIAKARGVRELGEQDRSIEWDFRPMYRLLRRVHECGLYHAVLHLDNLLTVPVDGRAEHYYIIDMPRAILFPRSIVGTRMAWFDLQYISHGLVSFLGVAVEELPLAAYGMDEKTQRRFRAQLPRFSRSKLRRKRLRVEAVLRLWLN